MTVITDDNFKSEVTEYNGAVVVDYHASWCGPCRQVGPIFSELEGQYAGKVKFVKADVDEAGETAANAGVSSVPCFKVYVNGKETASKLGSMTEEALMEFINGAVR